VSFLNYGLHSGDKNSIKDFQILPWHIRPQLIFTKPNFDANPQIKEMIASQTALGRVGVPDDIGERFSMTSAICDSVV